MRPDEGEGVPGAEVEAPVEVLHGGGAGGRRGAGAGCSQRIVARAWRDCCDVGRRGSRMRRRG